jgi:hypothetical protein
MITSFAMRDRDALPETAVRFKKRTLFAARQDCGD